MMPVRPPIRNIDRKPPQNSMGESKRIRPPSIVASQLKDLMPVGVEERKVDTAKKRGPRLRARRTMTREAVRGGRAKRIRTEVQRIVQTKNGTLRRPIPGQRRPRMVATKFTAAATVPTPLTARPSAHRSVAAVR